MGRWDITDIIIMKRITLLMALVVMGLATYANAPSRGQQCSWEDGNYKGSSSVRQSNYESESYIDSKSGNSYLYKHNGNIRYDSDGNANCVDGVGNERKGGYSY